MTVSPADLVGRTLPGGYRIVRPLGQGGMGVVYEAEQERPKRRVAVKVLFDADERSLARFHQEARAMAAVNHPNVAAVLDFRHENGVPPFFALELVEGMTLSALLRREKKLAPEQAIRIATQMLDALDAAHRAGVVHRDVKPGNVMLTKQGDVKLLDFGIAKLADGGSVKTTTGAIVGTPAYLAPEQLLGQPVDARTDVFAVGLVLYEMLTGNRARHDQTPVIEGAPPHVAKAIVRALEPHKDDRFESARAMRDALLGRLGERRVPTAPGKKPFPVLKVAAIALVVAVPSSAALIVFALRSPPVRSVVADASTMDAAEHDAAIVVDAEAAPEIVEAAPPPSSTTAPTATSSTKKPATSPYCYCREMRSDGYHQPLCLAPKKPECTCIHQASGGLLCLTSFASGTSCPVRTPRAGNEGDACEGFFDPSGVMTKATGTLACDYCYGDIKGVPAVHGGTCTGYDSGRKAIRGFWVCDGLTPVDHRGKPGWN